MLSTATLRLSAGFLLSLIPLAAATTVSRYRPHDFSFHAKVSGDPFAVELHGEFHGPDGVTLRVPGFYDGGDTWKIRFTAPREGEWRLHTVSAVAALNAREEQITAGQNTNPYIHGLLRVDPDHPYHFRWDDGARFFLMGYEADWLGLAQMEDPERKAMRRLIDLIRARGFNYVLANVYAHDTRWAPGKSCEWDYGPPAMYAFGGTNEKPDHTRLNIDFFKAHEKMMYALWEKGIVAHLMIKVYNKNVNWPAVNVEFGYEYGVENLPTHKHRNQSDWKEHLRRAYMIYFAGGYGAYYYNNTAWDVVKPDPEPPGMARWQTLKQTLSELPYWRMSPCNELAVGGPGLCDGGRTRAFYLDGERITLNLRMMDGDGSAVWVNTWTGDRVQAGSVQQRVVTLRKPTAFAETPAVLIVAANGRAATAQNGVR